MKTEYSEGDDITVEYIIGEHGERYPEDTTKLCQKGKVNVRGIALAERVAEEFFHNGGYECTWPLTFDVCVNGAMTGSYEVELEHIPYFTAKLMERRVLHFEPDPRYRIGG